jgi:Putative prokaryotic signal transducing protein
MIEVLRTNDPIRLDYAMVLLKDAGCYPFVADRFMAAAEGSILAVERRILVPDEFAALAKEALKQLEVAHRPLSDDETGDWAASDGDGE